MGTLFGSPTAGASGRPGRRLGRAAVLALALPVIAAPTAAFAVDSAPVVTNTVTATYDADYAWQVFNAVDRNRAEVAEGGTAAVRYAVGVIALGPPARSGFEVAGTIGVTNPGATVTATVSASLAGAAACVVAATDTSPADGVQVVLPSGASSFAYTCAPGSAPAGPAVTTATVATDAGSGSDDAQADYAVDQKTDELTSVSTSTDGGAPADLGTLDWDDVWAAPDHRVLVRTSSMALGVTDGPCDDHANVATESADATTDSEVVTVCQAEVLGEQSFGKAVGNVRTTCRGAVRARLDNRSGRAVFYYLRVGGSMHRFVVRSLGRKTVTVRGASRAVVVLKAGSRQLERTRLPKRCPAPIQLPEAGDRLG
ncbi:hypothetical protein L2K70_00105 [Nocardioides KLBMP 9356]|uniref:Uncharacterized protein n=1 Tax=Nocardioides potassii TaxID=2911371 RepID=A0ABS9H414_9ACTN|nr:hypothetical protein [Nocardioides potassii]MCF6376001.1 hypothetical protein [Nocardioides potassii]